MKPLRILIALALAGLCIFGIYSGINTDADYGPPLILFSGLGILASIGLLTPLLTSARPHNREGMVPSPPDETPKKKLDLGDEADQMVTFIIVQNYTDEDLKKIVPLLKEEARIESISFDEGRYYSVPDGQDLPEWFSIHVSCKRSDRDVIISDLHSNIVSRFGNDLANKLQYDDV